MFYKYFEIINNKLKQKYYGKSIWKFYMYKKYKERKHFQ